PFAATFSNEFLGNISGQTKHLFLWKTLIGVDNIQCFYENIKRSSLKDATLIVPTGHAAIFANKIMGITNLSFWKNNSKTLRTTKDNVFYVEHRALKIILIDGATESMVYRSSEDRNTAYIIIKKSPFNYCMTRIPVVDPSVAHLSRRSVCRPS
ncbi:hypothetical protein PMAYCL1PPCAC_05725, partial [Pristionchus mayeri]